MLHWWSLHPKRSDWVEKYSKDQSNKAHAHMDLYLSASIAPPISLGSLTFANGIHVSSKTLVEGREGMAPLAFWISSPSPYLWVKFYKMYHFYLLAHLIFKEKHCIKKSFEMSIIISFFFSYSLFFFSYNLLNLGEFIY